MFQISTYSLYLPLLLLLKHFQTIPTYTKREKRILIISLDFVCVVIFFSIYLASVASYTKMSDTSVSSPESPTTSNKSNAKKFEGDGVSFKGKLIGVDELSIDRDEKICLDSMFKLKAVVRARGEHKQKIQLNLTMSSVKIIDDTTKVFITVDFFLPN